MGGEAGKDGTCSNGAGDIAPSAPGTSHGRCSYRWLRALFGIWYIQQMGKFDF